LIQTFHKKVIFFFFDFIQKYFASTMFSAKTFLA